VLVQFALVVLSAIALDDLVSVSAAGRRVSGRAIAIVCIPALLSVLTTALFNTHRLPFMPAGLTPAPWRDALGGTVMVATVTLVFIAATRLRRAIPLLIICVAIDLACWGTIFVFNTRPRHPPELTSTLPRLETGFRYEWAEDVRDRPILKGYWVATGYAGLFPRTALPFGSPEFLRLSGVRATVSRDGAVLPTRDPSARASFPTGSSTTAAVITDRPGHIVIAADTTTTERLVITERMHEGWTATVDHARALPVVAFARDFISCDVPPGRHRIEFRFQPRSFRNGEIASGLGVFALIAGIYWASRR
jgi:hypothetical protein